MDIRCRFCGEPWDNDSIHEEVEQRNNEAVNSQPGRATYTQVAAEFRRFGCGAMVIAFGGPGAWLDPNGTLRVVRCNACEGHESLAGEHMGETVYCNGQCVVPNQALSTIYDVMGDDMDGAASMIEDAEHMGLF